MTGFLVLLHSWRRALNWLCFDCKVVLASQTIMLAVGALWLGLVALVLPREAFAAVASYIGHSRVSRRAGHILPPFAQELAEAGHLLVSRGLGNPGYSFAITEVLICDLFANPSMRCDHVWWSVFSGKFMKLECTHIEEAHIHCLPGYQNFGNNSNSRAHWKVEGLDKAEVLEHV